MSGNGMRCVECGEQLTARRQGGVYVDACPACGALWVLDKNFSELRAARDEFIRWLNPDLWSDVEKHERGETKRECPACGKPLHEVRYADSDIALDICPSCKGIWLDRGELDKIVAYLGNIVDHRKVMDYLKEMGHEAADMIAHREKIAGELKNMGILMKLLEFRIISRFPALSRIASKLPPL